MFDLTRFDPSLLIPDAAGYGERLAAALRILASGCGLDPNAEVERFRRLHDALTTVEQVEVSGIGQALGSALSQIMPSTYELALTFSEGRALGFAYLSQGANAGSLPASMHALLKTTLETYLGSGAPPSGAQLLAELVATAFPDPQPLLHLQGSAQGLLVAFIPRAEQMQLKVYFNTRILADGDHRGRVRRMLERVGVDTARFDDLYDVMYEPGGPARFAGVGVDVDGSQRAKIYVRVDTEHAFEHLRRVAQHLGLELDMQTLINRYRADDLANEHEIAVALRGDGPPSLKWTYFFGGRELRPSVERATSELLREHGCEPSLYEETSAALAHQGKHRSFPLHGVGLEFPSPQQKVNLYLAPPY